MAVALLLPSVVPGIRVTHAERQTALLRDVLRAPAAATEDNLLDAGFAPAVAGFRHGFLSEADSNILFGGILLAVLNLALFALCYVLLRSGWKIKN